MHRWPGSGINRAPRWLRISVVVLLAFGWTSAFAAHSQVAHEKPHGVHLGEVIAHLADALDEDCHHAKDPADLHCSGLTSFCALCGPLPENGKTFPPHYQVDATSEHQQWRSSATAVPLRPPMSFLSD